MTPEQKKLITNRVAVMSTQEDLLNILNEIKRYELGKNAIPFRMKQLKYHSNPNLNKNRYTIFKIPKKSGGERTIMAPNKGLKMLQFCMNKLLQTLFKPNSHVCGFVEGTSMVDGAERHVNRNYIFSIDLKNFFPSIDQARVWKRLQYPPFDFTQEIASMVAGLCCHPMEVERLIDGEWRMQIRSVLPQGAPTSPVLSNIICKNLDVRLIDAARSEGVRYSRYADDITFSSSFNKFDEGIKLRKQIEEIITSEGFRLNTDKTRLQGSAIRQKVTGLVVNEKVNVPRREIKKLRVVLHNWEMLGYKKASGIFKRYYHKTKRTYKGEPNMVNVIGGKLDYLRMVKGEDDSTYVKLKNRYDCLCKMIG